jgi:hypothetical protein
MSRQVLVIVALSLAAVALLMVAAVGALTVWFLGFSDMPRPRPVVLSGSGGNSGEGDTYTIERTEYKPPQRPQDDLLSDDRLEDKVTAFDPDLIFPKPRDGWQINLSDAVLRLDVPMILPDSEGHLLTLHPSYAAAVRSLAGTHPRTKVLPSVNLIDGKAKQFDDGLYAAIDLAHYQGLEDRLQSHCDLFARMLEKVGPDSPAAPFLAAGLTLAQRPVPEISRGEIDRWLTAFERDEVRSKPIGFYTWSPELEQCFRVLRFYQQPFQDDLTIPRALAVALAQDAELRADYERVLGFHARLTNPLRGLSVADLIDRAEPVPRTVKVALLPASTSRETELLEALFPFGLPPNSDLMRELIQRIRSGEVDLAPRPDSGWYDHQVFALETLLLPEKGRENAKLLLTRSYKTRMLEAFKALMTKRRETHSRQLDVAMAPTSAVLPPLQRVAPQLRLEPNATYYLRTARAYSFLAGLLEATVGTEALRSLHGLREGGSREMDLWSELQWMREHFYGCYLLACEDVGLRPEFADGEEVDRERCARVAADWLARIDADPDLAVDTRVSVPVFVDLTRGRTKLWATLGVRLAKLNVRFARPPRVRPEHGSGDWEVLRPDQLDDVTYFIPVDEFAEVELKGLRTLNRQEFRAFCDRHRTKEAILSALQQ